MQSRVIERVNRAFHLSLRDTAPECFGKPRWDGDAKFDTFVPTRAERAAIRVGDEINWPVTEITAARQIVYGLPPGAGGVTLPYLRKILLRTEHDHLVMNGHTQEQSFVHTLCHELGHVFGRNGQPLYAFRHHTMHPYQTEEAIAETAASEAVYRIFGIETDPMALSYVATAMRIAAPHFNIRNIVDAVEGAVAWYEPIVREALKREGVTDVR